MEAIIGRYRLQMEGFCLILTHTTRFRFEMTLDEALGLMEFIQNYQTARATAQGGAEPSVKEGAVDGQFGSNTGRAHAPARLL
jgi:hypothetical protein